MAQAKADIKKFKFNQIFIALKTEKMQFIKAIIA